MSSKHHKHEDKHEAAQDANGFVQTPAPDGRLNGYDPTMQAEDFAFLVDDLPAEDAPDSGSAEAIAPKNS